MGVLCIIAACALEYKVALLSGRIVVLYRFEQFTNCNKCFHLFTDPYLSTDV